MLESFLLEQERLVHDQLNTSRQRRFRWLVQNRNYLARIIAELACWGICDVPSLDRQLQLTEDAITGLIPDAPLAAGLSAEWAVRDAALLHVRNEAPAGFDCSVCRSGGRYGLEEMLARLPDPIE